MAPQIMYYIFCMTSNTITIRLRRPKAEVEANAKPNVNAWVNRLIEHALRPRKPDWNEHFDRPSSGRKAGMHFRPSGRFNFSTKAAGGPNESPPQ